MPLRRATEADEPFLREMLLAAAHWRDEHAAGLLPAAVVRYVEGFGRPGDIGIVAWRDDEPVGAAWARRFPASEPGYGFVAEDVPELSIGVRTGHRGRGIGSALLEALMTELAHEGVALVSLSVEPDNPARRLYERAGFERVGGTQGAWTLVRRLDGTGERAPR